MKRILPALLLLFLTNQLLAQDSYKETFFLAGKAIQEKDPAKLKEYLITDSQRSEQAALAIAELLVEIQSGQFDSFHKTYKEDIKMVNTKPLNTQMMKLAGLFMMPPLGEVAEYNLIQEGGKSYLISYIGNDNLKIKSKFEIQMKEKKWYFWPSSIEASDELVSLAGFLKKYKAVFEQNSKELRPEAIQKLADEYVKPTTLSYTGNPVNGKINGKPWAIKSGQASQSMSFGKKEIRISLSDATLEKDCPSWLNGNKVIISVEEGGEFDLALTGKSITLFTETSNKNTSVIDGKILITIDKSKNTISGKVAVRRDDDNFVSGVFEIPICGDLD